MANISEAVELSSQHAEVKLNGDVLIQAKIGYFWIGTGIGTL